VIVSFEVVEGGIVSIAATVPITGDSICATSAHGFLDTWRLFCLAAIARVKAAADLDPAVAAYCEKREREKKK
jgi:hypothetical protein